MRMISAETQAGAVAPRGALIRPRALAPSGYPTAGFTAVASASSCMPTGTKAIQATKPATWLFADVRNHRTRRLWEPSQ